MTTDPTAAADIQRLVSLSPFFLDRTEVTVGELRASGVVQVGSNGQPLNVGVWSGSRGGNPGVVPQNYCTYTVKEGANEALPVNCIPKRTAEAYCASRGKRLPTEAEIEYAASGLASFRYVSGDDSPRCTDAVFGHGIDGPCEVPYDKAGPRPPATGARDRLDLGAGGFVYDLSGNLGEWVADLWNRQDEPCWGSGVFRDPVCESVSARDGRLPTARGGNWMSIATLLKAARRERADEPNVSSIQLGFRCARSATAE